MIRLACDMARCMTPKGCPQAQKCLRNLDQGEGCYRVPVMAFPGGDDCHGFINIGERND